MIKHCILDTNMVIQSHVVTFVQPEGPVSTRPWTIHDVLDDGPFIPYWEQWPVIPVFWMLSPSVVYSCNPWDHSSNSSFKFHHVFTFIIGSTAMHTVAFYQSLYLFQWPGARVFNTSRIHCYMRVSVRKFTVCGTMYFLNYLHETYSHGQHLPDSSIAVFSTSWTVPIIYAFILSKLLIALMGFPRLVAAFHTETAYGHTQVGWMTCAMHSKCFLNSAHWIPKASSVGCASWVVE